MYLKRKIIITVQLLGLITFIVTVMVVMLVLFEAGNACRPNDYCIEYRVHVDRGVVQLTYYDGDGHFRHHIAWQSWERKIRIPAQEPFEAMLLVDSLMVSSQASCSIVDQSNQLIVYQQMSDYLDLLNCRAAITHNITR